MDNLAQELAAIKGRNRKVEQDKAWELSWTRRIFISLITYIVAYLWLLMIHEPNAWWKAFVPVAGYVLSTLTLPPLKAWWSKKLLTPKS